MRCSRQTSAYLPAPPRPFAAFGVQAPGWLIVINITREGELIFDPFCGSGTTGVVAKELGRLLVGAELEGEFCELAGRRIKYAARGSVLREISGQLSASPVT